MVPGDERRRRPQQAVRKLQCTYPGEPGQVRQVREDIARVFGWCPMAEELVLVASELATNAIQHSRSGDGGQFTVTVSVRHGDYARIDVEDQGGKSTPRNLGDPDGPQAERNPDSSLGQGLAIVGALAGEGNWGLGPQAPTRLPDGMLPPEENTPGHVAWARISWLPVGHSPPVQVNRLDGVVGASSTECTGYVSPFLTTDPRERKLWWNSQVFMCLSQ